MAKNFTYVDNSNVYIEGARVSAVAKGLPGAATIVEAMNNRVVDFSWQIDYGALHQFACGDPADIGGREPVGLSTPVRFLLGDGQTARVRGHQIRSQRGRKREEGRRCHRHKMTKDAYTGVVKPGVDEMTLVAGDKDYVPMVEDLVKSGFLIHLVFWDHAARELKDTASKFISLDNYLDFLTKKWTPHT